MMDQAHPAYDDLQAELRKLRKINKVLMDRVERNMDAQNGDAFSLFQTAIVLDGRVSERTDELTRLTQRLMHEIAQRRETEKALLAAKADAEQANLGKTHFLAAASHDLHQPLNAARLFLGALAAEAGPGRTLDLVRRVETALETVRELIDAVMAISRLDTGAWIVAPASFPIDPLLRQLEEEFAPQAAACGLAFRTVRTSLIVHTDRTLLQRALANLISNAIRYTRSGRILLGCRRLRSGVRVEVWDTGIGIPSSALPEIFKEFRQLGSAPRADDKGFGLGLAIVERIVRLLDLKIDVQSQAGKGSCFSLLVPRGEARDVPLRTDVGMGPILGKPYPGVQAVCISPETAANQALAMLLESWGCQAVVAETVVGAGEGGLAEAMGERRPPDLIIADYDLAGGEKGIDAVLMLRNAYGRDIPAIIVCRDRSAAVRDEVQALACGFLPKPVRPARLRAMLGHVLDQEPAA